MASSPLASSDAALRHLLDQRAARADIASNFSFSDYDDSPSVYSRAVFSPVVHDDIAYRDPPLPTNNRTDRDRLNDPALSSLDFGDDSRSSYMSTSRTEDDLASTHRNGPVNEDEDAFTEDESMSRMSMLGPRMRFHSPAPWELDDEDVLPEEDEPDNGSIHQFPNSRGGKRHFGFGASSPRTSNMSSRPSGETSSRAKKSFETNSSGSQTSVPRNAIQTLAQASLSSTSLTPSMAAGSHSLLQKISFGRGRPQTPTGSIISSPFPPSNDIPVNFSHTFNNPHQQPASCLTVPERNHQHHSNRESTALFQSFDDDDSKDHQLHPYANPRLASYVTEPSPSPETSANLSDYAIMAPSAQLGSVGVSRSNCSIPITESSIASSATKFCEVASSPTSRKRMQGKEISSPIAIPTDILPGDPNAIFPPANGITGWSEHSNPGFALISLEEARAKRSRSATVQTYDPVASNQAWPFPEVERDAAQGSNFNVATRQRSRSTSTTVRARQVINTVKGASAPKLDRRDSESTPTFSSSTSSTSSLPGKTIKHRKSGFMRIFNGRDREKEDKIPPPPVPLLLDNITSAFAPQSQPALEKPQPSITSYRVPVPRLTPSVFEGISDSEIASQQINGIASNDNTSPVSMVHVLPYSSPTSPASKRTPPLSIDTARSQSSFAPAYGFSKFLKVGQSAPTFTNGLDGEQFNSSSFPPASAPPQVTEFGLTAAPSLKLRPMSTLFSSSFGDKFISSSSITPTLEDDLDTPCSTSPTTAPSPITPTDSSQNSAQDQSSIIQALQEQIVSAKMAWQRQIWELEGQVRDLKAEIEEARTKLEMDQDYCAACGRGGGVRTQSPESSPAKPFIGVVNRPRARTGVSYRFASHGTS